MLAFQGKINQLLNCTWISPKWFVLIFLFNIDLWQPTKSFVTMRMKLQVLSHETWQLPYCLISGVFILQKYFKWMIIERQEQIKHMNLPASPQLWYSFDGFHTNNFILLWSVSILLYLFKQRWEDTNFKHSRYKHLYCIFDVTEYSIYFLNNF